MARFNVCYQKSYHIRDDMYLRSDDYKTNKEARIFFKNLDSPEIVKAWIEKKQDIFYSLVCFLKGGK